MKRRAFVLGSIAGGATLVVGWLAMPPRGRQGDALTLPGAAGRVGLNGWIGIDAGGHVLLAMPRSEMGQGVHTALAMLAAEELDVPLARVRLIEAAADTLYGNVAMFVGSLPFHPAEAEPGAETRAVRAGRWVVAKAARELGINVTGGSSSVADAWEVLPLAAATARAQLLGAASLRWKQPVAELTVIDGVIHHASGLAESYATFARAAAAMPAGDVRTKDPAGWTLVGRAAPRIDSGSNVDGSAVFGIDVRLPGMLHAALRQCPVLGGTVGAVDVSAALSLPGVERVVRLGTHAGSSDGLAVVGVSHWHAERGAAALRVDWRPPPAGTPDTAAIEATLERVARQAAADGSGHVFHARGDVAGARAGAARHVERLYRAPYLAHAAMEPINCTARVGDDGRVEVWVPTQVPGLARAAAARAAGVAPDVVTVHVTTLGGGFGRRLEVDVVGQAVRIAVETGGRPVQLVWSREEDLGHDFYRPAGAALLRADLDAQGLPLALAIASAGDAITPRWIERTLPALAGPVELPDKTADEGLFDLPYGIAHQRIAHVATQSGVPVGYWRSVGHSHHAFFAECFVDELAEEARLDPLAFRLALLKDAPRHAAVLRLAAAKAGWGTPLAVAFGAPRRARGMALHESFGSIVAQVAEVSIAAGVPRVHRVVCAADVGTVVNPGIVAQQMEGGVLFGLAAALHGRIDIDAGVVRQRNFPDVRVLTVAETPAIETHLVPSSRSPAGVGEPGTPPIAPAVANALYVLTGKRLRALPLTL
jgi:isoquinoline 1-oxidoreductase subunit beta